MSAAVAATYDTLDTLDIVELVSQDEIITEDLPFSLELASTDDLYAAELGEAFEATDAGIGPLVRVLEAMEADLRWALESRVAIRGES